MNKSQKDKLLELKQKKAKAQVNAHKEILDSNASIKEAIVALHEAINAQEPYNDSKLVDQLKELKESQTFTKDIERLEQALKNSSNKDKLDEVIKAVGNINNNDVVIAVNNLIERLDDNTAEQDEEAFRPVRRVIKMGQRLIFDDNPTGNSGGGGGGGIQSSLIRDGAEGRAIAVVNPDGSNIGGGGSGGNVTVDNFPAEYPLSASQVTTLTPQTDALTDAELRANPLDVNIETTNYTTRIETDSVNSNLTYIGNAVIGTAESASSWQIKRLDSTNGLIKLWANGSDDFNVEWDNRESEVYA